MTRPRTSRAGRSGRAIVLLDVLLAVGLFVIAAAVVTSALSSALTAATDLRLKTRAADLAQTVLSRLTSGELPLEAVAATEVDETDPEWTYEIAIEPVDGDDILKRVIVTVRNSDPLRPKTCRLTQWMLQTATGQEEAVAP